MEPTHDVGPGSNPPQDIPRRQANRPRLGRLGRGILWRFTFFALLSLLIMSATGIYAAYLQVQEIQSHQQQIAKWAASSMDAWYQELHNNLIAASLDPSLMDATPEEKETVLRQVMVRSPTFDRVILVDSREGNRGVELLQVNAYGTSSGENYYGSEWFYPTLIEGRYTSSIRPVRGMPSIMLSQAIENQGRVVGVIAAEADVSWAYRLLKQFRSDEAERGSYIYMVDKQGRPILHGITPLVASRDLQIDIVGIRAAIYNEDPPPILIYPGLNADRVSTEELDMVIGAYQEVENIPCYVIAEQPVRWIIGRLRFLGLAALGVILLSALAAGIVGVYISQRVAVPIMHLREGAQRIGAGDLEHSITLHGGRNELRDLADEFNRMTANLRDSQAQLEEWGQELEGRITERTSELRQAFEQLQQEAHVRENLIRTIRQMASPVIPVTEDVLVMPIVGTLDSERAQRITEDLLKGIERDRARAVIIDITGLAVVDTAVANALLQAAQAAQLLGAQAILVGITPEVAETVVQLGVDLQGLHTAATLQSGLQLASALLQRRSRVR